MSQTADAEAGNRLVEPTPEAPLLSVRGLRKHYVSRSRDREGHRAMTRAVDNVSFDVRTGETFALVGESGCGKTTAARCIVRATEPTAGAIEFRLASGETVNLAAIAKRDLQPLRTQFQMVLQDPYSSLNPRLCVRDIIAEPLIVHRVVKRSEIEARVGELLDHVGLRRDHMSRYPNAFSGGQRQRISIARALALKPRLIVFDEAVSALDVSVQAQILNLLMDLQDAFGLSYLFVSHDLSVVKSISDRVGVMYVGQMVELAPSEALFARPLHPYTAALIAAAPKADPTHRSEGAVTRGEAASPRNPPSGCYFHPRCPFSVDRCKHEAPAWEEVTPSRFVRCHRVRELNLAGTP